MDSSRHARPGGPRLRPRDVVAGRGAAGDAGLVTPHGRASVGRLAEDRARRDARCSGAARASGATRTTSSRSCPPLSLRAGLDAEVVVSTWTARGGRIPDLPPGVRQVGVPVPARLVRGAWAHVDLPPVEALVGRCDVFHGPNFVSPPTRARARGRHGARPHLRAAAARPSSPDALAYRHARPPRAGPRRARRDHHAPPWPTSCATSTTSTADRVRTTPLGVDDEWFDVEPADAARAGRRGPARALPALRRLARPAQEPAAAARGARGPARSPSRHPAPGAGRPGRPGRPGSAGLPDVHLTGWLDDPTLRRVVAACSALVLPSLDEGFGLTALEALACGRPLVVSDIPTLREVADPHAVLCRPDDVDDIARALDDVLDAADGPGRARRPHRRRPSAAPGRPARTRPSRPMPACPVDREPTRPGSASARILSRPASRRPTGRAAALRTMGSDDWGTVSSTSTDLSRHRRRPSRRPVRGRRRARAAAGSRLAEVATYVLAALASTARRGVGARPARGEPARPVHLLGRRGRDVGARQDDARDGLVRAPAAARRARPARAITTSRRRTTST